MKITNLGTNAIIGQRVLNLTRDVSIDVPQTVQDQAGKDQRGHRASQADDANHRVAAVYKAPARALRPARSSTRALVVAGVTPLIVYGHGCRPSKDLINSNL